MALHVRSGDMVKVICGKNVGKIGKILSVDAHAGRVIVEGVNRHYKHVRRTQENQQGGRIMQEMPIHISNVQPVTKVDGTLVPTRVRFERRDDGSKVRVAVKSGEELSVLKKAKK
jgi:large subunit ribosomal protein L24